MIHIHKLPDAPGFVIGFEMLSDQFFLLIEGRLVIGFGDKMITKVHGTQAQ